LNKVDLYIWANDYSSNTGEGRLARNFISFLKKEYPRNLIKIKTPQQEFLLANSKIEKNYTTRKNNFFYKYFIFIYGIIYLWSKRKNKIVYINYLPLWNFLIFLLLPKKTILGPITGGVKVDKINNLENFFRIILFPIFYRISLFIINFKFKRVLFATNLLKKYIKNKNQKNFFYGYIYNLFNLNRNFYKKKYDLVFYNRNYNSKKNYLVKKIISKLQNNLKICVIGDSCKGNSFANKGYVAHKKVLKFICQSKMAFATSENLLSLFAIDCYNSGVKLIYDKRTLLDNTISNKNSLMINYKNPEESSKIILSQLLMYKFNEDHTFIEFLNKKKYQLRTFLKDYFKNNL
jgi:hypothetical protein